MRNIFGIKYVSPTGTNEIASGESRRNGAMVGRVPEGDKYHLRHSSLTGTGSFLRHYRRVLPDAIECVPFRDAAADAFEVSFSNTASATAEHVAATADEAAKVRAGMVIVRILDGIVKNRYANGPGKLATWISASHVEKAPKKKEPTP
jgi:hypothetical protein